VQQPHERHLVLDDQDVTHGRSLLIHIAARRSAEQGPSRG
jgi:hypothetical protein